MKTHRTPLIMIVDDEEDTVNVFKTHLEDFGYRVESFTDPLKALSSFKPKHYDLLLLDVKMPSMNGFQLYREMQRIDGTCKACFITAFEVYYRSLLNLSNSECYMLYKKANNKERIAELGYQRA